MSTFEHLNFDNLTLRTLPVLADTKDLTVPRQKVSGASFSRAKPTPVENPSIVAASAEALALLGLDPNQLARPDASSYLCGNLDIPGAEPAAHCYCGHQFGHFSGQLGDGATMYLGEVLNRDGERWELQFKGAGRTHYSRQADGRKVLRSSLREFFASEVMHALGVPTTRAGSLVTSDTFVERDAMYNGNVKRERASIVLRIARSFLRFGSFEVAKPADAMTGRAGPSAGQTDIVKALLDHTAGLLNLQHIAAEQERYVAIFTEIVERTARLVAHWQCVGFCHGVLNTDNMSVLGDTIDYGPFGFLEAYDPEHVCNMSDGGGRYAFKEQPTVCRWNCEKLAEALQPFVPEKQATAALARFDAVFEASYTQGMRAKLGLSSALKVDETLVRDLLDTMQATGADYTHTFRVLSNNFALADAGSSADVVAKIISRCSSPVKMALAQESRARSRGSSIPKPQLLQLLQMAQRNPEMLQMFGGPPELVKAELEGELRKMEEVEELQRAAAALRRMPAEEKRKSDGAKWTAWLQRYAERLAAELPPSTPADANFDAARQQAMRRVNPRVVLHNWIAQEAIEAAEAGNYEQVRGIFEVLTRPFDDGDDHYANGGPESGAGLCVS